MRKVIVILVAVFAFIFVAFGQDKDKPIPLSEPELKRLNSAWTAFDVKSKALNQAINEGATVPLECEKVMAALVRIREARLAVLSAQNDWQAALELVKVKHNCETCDLSPDGKSLVKPAK